MAPLLPGLSGVPPTCLALLIYRYQGGGSAPATGCTWGVGFSWVGAAFDCCAGSGMIFDCFLKNNSFEVRGWAWGSEN